MLRITRLCAAALVSAHVVGCSPASNESKQQESSAPNGVNQQASTMPPVVTGANLSSGNPHVTVQSDGTIIRNASGPSASLAEPAVPDELLVKFKSAYAKESLSLAKLGIAAQTVRTFKSVSGLQQVKLTPGLSTAEAVAQLKARAEVEYVEPNFIFRKQSTPNDPQFTNQWNLRNTGQLAGFVDGDIDADDAWDVSTGGAGAVVAVVDTGVDYSHEDLAANMFRNSGDCDADGVDDDNDGYVDDCYGIDTANQDSNPMDDDGHGTHVAGIMAANTNNGVGVAGVAPHAKILACKFIQSDGSGTAADAIACLDYVALMKDRGVNIVATNNSWAGEHKSRALEDAIRRQLARGILFVTATGNGPYWEPQSFEVSDWLFEDGALYPCGYSLANIICVASSDRKDDISIFSYVGEHTVHVMAPGEDIVSTLPGNTYGVLSGTSMATPHVTGILALLRSQFPSASWIALRNRLLAGGETKSRPNATQDFGWSGTITRRRVNAVGALTCNNSVVTKRLLPRASQMIEFQSVNVPVDLAVLNINCGQANGPVSVAVSPGNEVIQLRDDGSGIDDVAGDGIYSGRWTPQSGGEYVLTFPGVVLRDTQGVVADTLKVEVDANLKPGFPVKTLHSAGTIIGASEPTLVGNIDSTPDIEIVATGRSNGPNYAWKATGELIPGWPLPRNGRMYHMSWFSIGDLDRDFSQREVIGGVYDDSTNTMYDTMLPDPMEAYSGSGQMLPGWPHMTANYSHVQPTLVDIDGDGVDEIFADEEDYKLHGYRGDGSVVPGFPLTPATFASGFVIAQGVVPPLAGDLDGDGRPELILVQSNGSNWALVAIDGTGAFVPGFPRAMAQPLTLFGTADVDADGATDILSLSQTTVAGQLRATVQVLNSDGIAKNNFVIADAAINVAGAALGDLDQDGIPEIVVAYVIVDSYWQRTSYYITAFKGNGQIVSGWPRQLNVDYGSVALSPPVIGDVDGDRRADIVVTAAGTLQALHADGTTVAGLPKHLFGTFAFYNTFVVAPAIADIDADGRNDIVIATDMWDGRQGYLPKVLAYDLHGAANSGPIEWGQHLESGKHQGHYELGKNLVSDAFLAVRVHGDGSVKSATSGIDCGSDCIQRYPKSTTVKLTATARSGSFARWRGACAGQGNPCTLNIAAFTPTSAEFGNGITVSVSGHGVVTSSPSGITCPGTCSQNFASGVPITFTAQPQADSAFVGWSGACTGTALTCTTNADAARTLKAVFAIRPMLSISVNGDGRVTSNSAGIDCSADCSKRYDAGTSVFLIAVPNSGSVFAGWSGSCSGSSAACSLTMDSDRQITATFTKVTDAALSVEISGTGNVVSNPSGIDCPGACVHSYSMSTSVVLSAQPLPGAVFTGWSGACTGSANTCSVDMSSARSVHASFGAPPTFALTLSLAGDGHGRVVSDPVGIDCGADCVESYSNGQTVTLQASADSASEFNGWSGACSGQSAVCVLNVTSDANATASFKIKPSAPLPSQNQTGSSSGSTSGSKSGGGGGSSDWPLLIALLWLRKVKVRRAQLTTHLRTGLQ